MNTGKGQNRIYFSEYSDKTVPGSFGSFGETDNGYRIISIFHPIGDKVCHLYQKISLADRTQKYYTDGKLVDIQKLDKNGNHVSGNLIGNKEVND